MGNLVGELYSESLVVMAGDQHAVPGGVVGFSDRTLYGLVEFVFEFVTVADPDLYGVGVLWLIMVLLPLALM